MSENEKVTLLVKDAKHYLGITRTMIVETIPRLNRALNEIDNLTMAIDNNAFVPKTPDLSQEKFPKTELRSAVFRFDKKASEFNGC